MRCASFSIRNASVLPCSSLRAATTALLATCTSSAPGAGCMPLSASRSALAAWSVCEREKRSARCSSVIALLDRTTDWNFMTCATVSETEQFPPLLTFSLTRKSVAALLVAGDAICGNLPPQLPRSLLPSAKKSDMPPSSSRSPTITGKMSWSIALSSRVRATFPSVSAFASSSSSSTLSWRSLSSPASLLFPTLRAPSLTSTPARGPRYPEDRTGMKISELLSPSEKPCCQSLASISKNLSRYTFTRTPPGVTALFSAL
mmetsp:Transcript_20872/g.50426  ORF Transcript_20872/g.50426 Transcript_20872/m.50426 type:complete len:260 (-) Transcript_20872:1189-1968(-)